ncbi:MAG TPA: peptidase inhibitor family I36 protein [Actinophytocola sp.]|jgi:hypothetical protein|nr:peptidase inhibitor family I36 protein [Actinophytocola sp.]
MSSPFWGELFMRAIGKRFVQAALAIGGSAVMVAAVAGTASAATPRNGVCEVGEFCLYWGANLSGSVSDFNGSVSNYGDSQPTCYDFKGPGTGQGQCVKNNAVSAWNRTTANQVTVYFNSGWGGISDTYLPGESGNLIAAMQNQNASHKFVHI